jgi:hypothetical protein
MNLLPNLEPIWNISLSECMRSQMVQFCDDFFVFYNTHFVSIFLSKTYNLKIFNRNFVLNQFDYENIHLIIFYGSASTSIVDFCSKIKLKILVI